MEHKAVIETLRECGSLLEGHFLLTSGKHSDRYCQCAKLLQHPDKAASVVELITDQVKDLGAPWEALWWPMSLPASWECGASSPSEWRSK